MHRPNYLFPLVATTPLGTTSLVARNQSARKFYPARKQRKERGQNIAMAKSARKQSDAAVTASSSSTKNGASLIKVDKKALDPSLASLFASSVRIHSSLHACYHVLYTDREYRQVQLLLRPNHAIRMPLPSVRPKRKTTRMRMRMRIWKMQTRLPMQRKIPTMTKK